MMTRLISSRCSISANRFISYSSLVCLILVWSCKSADLSDQSKNYSQEKLEIISEESVDPIDKLSLKQLDISKEKAIESYRNSKKRVFDILHMDLSLSFDYEAQTVIGHVDLRIKPFKYPQKILQIDAQDFELGKISFSQNGKSTDLTYSYDEQLIQIDLPRELDERDTFNLIFDYRAFPNKNSGGGSEAIQDTKGLYFIDPLDTISGKPRMIWTQGETKHNSKWFPTIDHPNERFTQRLNLSLADSLVSISNGELVAQKKVENGMRIDSWEMKMPHAPYLVAFTIGDFERVNATWEDIPMGYYVEKGYKNGAAKVFQNTPEMMGFFSDILGVKYPWPKYDQVVVRDFVSGAMENTTASIFMEELRLTEREAIDGEWDYIIAHELFHQWFGDYVTAESWSNLALNEAFANYSEFLWNEHKYGPDEAKLKLIAETENYFTEAEFKVENLIRFEYSDSEDMFDSHSYSKGGVILHMLREYLGKEVFYTGLNYYLKAHALQSVEVHDLRLAFEKISGEDLNWFFNQWFLDRGHPELEIEVDYSEPENILVSITQQQDLTKFPLFQIPFEISWYVDGEREKKKFFLNKGFQQFALDNKMPADQVYFDEEKNILANISIDRNAESYRKQFLTSKIGIARYEALDSLVSMEANEELKVIVNEGLSDSFWAIRESTLRIIQGNTSWLSEDTNLENKVFGLVENDLKNSVRAGAIDALASHDAVKYQQTFKRLANNPSYLISGSALMGLMEEGIDLESDFIAQFDAEQNFRIVLPVADFYITKPIPEKGAWFHSQLKTLSGEGLYFYLGYYAEYFSRFPQEGSEEAISSLFTILNGDEESFIRLGAFQALLAFSNEEVVIDRLVKSTASESDPELKRYYEYFIEAIVIEN